jgi:hypothetical protein
VNATRQPAKADSTYLLSTQGGTAVAAGSVFAARGRGAKFAYVIDHAGEWPFVSPYRYGSRESALKAAERDVADLVAFRAQAQ